MNATAHSSIRELDHRNNNGIDVRLLWNVQTNSVCVAVRDECLGGSLTFEVEAADALEAFQHPYAYAARPPHTPPVTRTSQPVGRRS